MSENLTGRFDPEYFIKMAVRTSRALEGGHRLGDFVQDGYRVVYENTKAIPRIEGEELSLPYFLQSADITTPFIDEASLVCVPEAEWLRYPKGRIREGELLIEVKGKAEKIAVVPPNFPAKTLVTGTCFKLTTKQLWQRSLLAAYLIGRHGKVLKDRLKTNLLVAYIAKDDLYRIPVPKFSSSLNEMVHEFVEASLEIRGQILAKQSEAELCMLEALDLKEWTPADPLTYTGRLSDFALEQRWDAQFYRPKFNDLTRLHKEKFDLFDLKGLLLKGRTVPYSSEGDIPIIRSGDLTDIEDETRLYKSNSSEPIFYLEKGDVLISSIGFGSIGKVHVFDKEGKFGTVSEVTVIRQTDLNPYYLAAYLRSELGQLQIERYITGATGQLHLYPRDVEKFLIPILSKTEQQKFELLHNEARKLKTSSGTLLEAAKRVVEIAIEDGEATAFTYLGQVREVIYGATT